LEDPEKGEREHQIIQQKFIQQKSL